LTTFSEIHSVNGRIPVGDKLERMWKETAVAYLKALVMFLMAYVRIAGPAATLQRGYADITLPLYLYTLTTMIFT
jgi:hypothetical protein